MRKVFNEKELAKFPKDIRKAIRRVLEKSEKQDKK